MKAQPFILSSKVLATLLALTLGLFACAEQQNAGTGTDTLSAMGDTAASDSMSADTSASGGGVQVAQNDSIGPYLTDAEGRTLYLFLKDEQNSGESTCYDACAGEWPPFTASQGAPTARGQAQSSMIDTLQRRDGATQVTYNGWPLYYYDEDRGADQVKGQDIEDYGAEWYVLTPQGTAAGHGEEEE